ncbi:MAG: serine/threonine protein kinase [Proteobacteria bacterium]|nr:serine/threonine protein kinase [Pseudomonadota bacterium]
MAVRPESLTEADLPVTFGPFELTSILGEGSMGRVFEAYKLGPSGFRKKTALKVLRRSIGADSSEFRDSLTKEARIGALLQHPNIIEIYDHGEVDEIPWVSMEYVDGVGLDELARRRALIPTQALDVAIQMCDALEYTTELQDFGIAKAAFVSGIVTASGHTRGTPSFMSPEQTRGLDLDVRSDLFTVATNLYLLITGRHLFKGGSVIEVMTSIVKVDSRLKSRATWLGMDEAATGLKEVLARALSFEPVDRYPTAGAFRTALQAVRQGMEESTSLSNFMMTVDDETLKYADESHEPVASSAEPPIEEEEPAPQAPIPRPEPPKQGVDWPVLLGSSAVIVAVVVLVVWIARSL